MTTNGNRARALVIGGSLAGLLAARVLSDSYAEVMVIDRDHLPEFPEHRRGVPQAPHAHALLARGQQVPGGVVSGADSDARRSRRTYRRHVA